MHFGMNILRVGILYNKLTIFKSLMLYYRCL